MLRVRVLGEFEVEGAEGPVELSGSWSARSVFAWLALHPGSHRRADLASRFWPEVLDSSARASLRNCLWAIRRALGDDAEALSATRERVELAGPPEVWVDAHAFADLVAAGELAEALELRRGELLAGFDEDWAHQLQDEHREAFSELLGRLAADAEAEGDTAGAIGLARRRSALDPLDEEAQRDLIERLARSGDRAGALASYERLRERFRSEMGISPSDETRRLIGEIRVGTTAAEPGSVPAPAASNAARSRVAPGNGAALPLPPRLRRRASLGFVGRERELRILREIWNDVTGGDGARCALVVGEAGIGKSRLVRQLALEAHDEGALVLHGTADEDVLVPHQALVTALEHLFDVASPTEMEDLVIPRAADLEPVAPRLGAMAGDGSGASSESRRYRLFEAVASLLDELGSKSPVLLVVDDLHWADQSTVAVLRHTLESRPDARLLVLATARPGTSSGGAGSEEATRRLAGSDFVSRLALAGLSEPALARLAEGVSGRELEPDLVTAIREQTGGNPFFAQEIVRDLSESDPTGGVLSLARADVPDRVREALDLRLGRLSEPCRRLLTVAAIIGGEFDLRCLEHVSDLQGDDVAAALDEGVAADLILEAQVKESESFTFAHALVRRTLLESITRAHRRRIHARVAQALEQIRGEEALLEIAHHLCEARPVSDREEALAYATRAAERATADVAYAEAVDLFTRARSLLPEEDDRRRTLALKRAVAYQALFHAKMDTAAD